MGSTKTTETKLPQWQEDFIRENILPKGLDIANAEYTPYTGDMIAGMTPLQDQALSGFGSLDMGGDVYEKAIDVQQGLSNFTPSSMLSATSGPVSTYGGATVSPASTYGGATVAKTQLPQKTQLGQVERYSGASISPIERAQAAQLGDAERMQGVGAVNSAQALGQIDVDQLKNSNLSQYINPYQQSVIDAGQADIERQRQLASNQLGAQAGAAGAFGGSRQAVQEGILAGEALRQSAQLSAQQRQAGFQQAVESGKFDISQTQDARTLASQQGFQAEQFGQQAREAAAAREQAARSGNMQAANQFASQQAQLEQQASMANQAAANARSQAQAQLQQQAGLSSMQAANQFTTQQGQLSQQAMLASAAQQAARASQQAGLTQGAGLASAASQNAIAAQQAGLTQAAGLASAVAQNAAAAQQAGLTQAAGLTGAAAQNAAAAQQAGLTQGAGLASAAAQNAAAAQQAGLTQGAGLSTQAAINQALQSEAARQQEANAANFQGQFNAAGIQSGAANAMAGLAQNQLGSQLSGLGAQMSAGEQQRAIEQAKLQADYAMFEQEQNYPLSQLNALLAAGSGVPAGLGTVTQRDPFGGLSAIGSIFGGIGSFGQGGGFYNFGRG